MDCESIHDRELPIGGEDLEAVEKIYLELRNRNAKLVGPDGETKQLPQSLYGFLYRLIADLEEGKSVSILQGNAQLTTVEAAKLLGVSRQFLVNQLDRNEIPHFLVGTHRRVYVRDLLAYKSRRDSARRAALDALSRSEVEAGTYDRITGYDSEPGQ
ncbi:MAG: helix-turn-helix domain-containing protein [Bryobacterales bacterium]|nr:helix-turn-helix domain-containing protein [Bryobacterales bacterium]